METMKLQSVSEGDAKIICDVVEEHWNEGYEYILQMVRRIFMKEITVDHYVMVGQIIGLKSATDSKRRAIIKINKLCQRVN